MTDAIVIGAGVVGASTAFHLAERGVDTLVVDREGPAGGSTARSGALIRAHYPTALEADLAWESITDYFEVWGERVGGGCGFTRTGFAFLAAERDADAVVSNVKMLKEQVGVETEIVGPDDLRELDPSVVSEGVGIVAYEPRGGYADPSATAVALMRAAERHGARFEQRTVLTVLETDGSVYGVETENGRIEAPVVVLAAGAWSVPIAASVGLDLPIRPARSRIAIFERPYNLPMHLTLIDSVFQVYCRTTAEHCTLVGNREVELEELEDPDSYAECPEPEFVQRVAKRIGRRIPALADAPYRLGRAGVIDNTPDGRPIMGPEGPEGLFLTTGWSGTGFKKAPAVGAELARWIDEGSPKRKELTAYNLGRFQENALVFGEHEYGVRTPH
jgi:sarcosine oxidase subunit beta